MAITIAVAMRKGGVGKSTTCQVLSEVLGSEGNRVLVIDMDSQCNTTKASGIDRPDRTIIDVLADECTMQQSIVSCMYYDLISADKALTVIEKAIIEESVSKAALIALDKAGIDTISAVSLRSAIESVRNQYDFIVIDTPPALGNLSYMSLVAADYVLIPMEPSDYGISGLADTYETVLTVQNGSNPALKVLGILLTKYNRRTVLSRDIREMIVEYAERMDTVVFDSTIRQSVAVQEAQMIRKPLIDYARNNNAIIDYKAFVSELHHLIR